MTCHDFFKHVNNNSIEDVLKILRNEKEKAWEYTEETEGYTVLHRACFNNQTQMVKEIISFFKKKFGIDAVEFLRKWINLKSNEGFSAIHFCSFRGNMELILLLIDLGAEVEMISNEGLNVLHMAAKGDQPAPIYYFKEKYSMSIMSVDESGSTPLHWAAYSGSKLAFCFLLSFKGNIDEQDKEGMTPLHLAVISNRVKLVKKLIQKNANKFILDHNNKSPVDIAFEKNRVEILKLFNEKNSEFYCNFKNPTKSLEKKKGLLYFSFFLGLLVTVFMFLTIYSYYRTLVTVVYIIVCFFDALNLILVMFSDPGYVVNQNKETFSQLIEQSPESNLIANYCPECVIRKRERTHHCFHCGKCVEYKKFHSIWFHKCIGRRNRYYFYSFLFLACAILIFNIVICSLILSTDKQDLVKNRNQKSLPLSKVFDETRVFVYSIIILGISVVCLGTLIFYIYRFTKYNLFRKKIKTKKDDDYYLI